MRYLYQTTKLILVQSVIDRRQVGESHDFTQEQSAVSSKDRPDHGMEQSSLRCSGRTARRHERFYAVVAAQEVDLLFHTKRPLILHH